MYRLCNTVRPYAWGSITAIPELLGTEPTGEPQAELWMGAHPGAPSRVDRGTGPAGPVSLGAVIGADPEGELGSGVVKRFGPRLPFLLKVLAAAQPLSVQVHPNLEQARDGFADEESRGVPVDAPHRNYHDANHKPELICALEPFDGLCGFREPARAADLLDGLGVDQVKAYAHALRIPPGSGPEAAGKALREVLTAVLGRDRDLLSASVADVTSATERLAAAGGYFAESYGAYAAIARRYPGDPGIFAAMLLNHVRLQPGEALYLGAGIPHAYLHGVGVEIMASSDNVLRCGLTPKHVDVPELLRVVDFRPRQPKVLRPATPAVPGGEVVYPAPVDDFRLSRYDLASVAPEQRIDGPAPQILLCTAGSVRLRDHAGAELVLRRGESAFVPARTAQPPGICLSAQLPGNATVFRATVVV